MGGQQYALVLQHCPKEFQAKLNKQEVWAAINDPTGVVRLIVLIRDLKYNKSGRKRSIVTTVKADFDLYSCAQEGKTTDEYYKIFVSNMDTINANGGSTGLHPSVFKKYLALMKDKGFGGVGEGAGHATVGRAQGD